MLTTVKGIHNNGEVVLEETPETAGPVEVLVTFTKDIAPTQKKKKMEFGSAKGLVLYIAPDFNEPLDDMKEYM